MKNHAMLFLISILTLTCLFSVAGTANRKFKFLPGNHKDTLIKDTEVFSEFKELPLKAKRKIPIKTTEGTWTQ
jgi:hypothetical protein